MFSDDPKNEIKLMILYLLNKISFSLNHEGISNFFIDNYTTFIVFQYILADLVETGLIEEYKTKTSVFYKISSDGTDALNSLIDKISEKHRLELDDYIKENRFKLKEVSLVNADYFDGENGNYRIKLEINENKEETFKLEIDVPTLDAATTMCENWKEKAKTIYAYVIKQLL